MTHERFVFQQRIICGVTLISLAAGFFVGVLTAPAMGAEPVVIISRSDCARMVAHKPAAGVAYTPGVDVQGRAVAPADLPGTPQIAMPDEIVIDITVELQKRFGIPSDATLFKPEARVGTVVVKPDGSATFNGQALTSPEQQALAALCQKQGASAR